MPLVANNAASRLAASIGAADTSISLQAGTGGMFPSPTGGDWFPLTLIKPTGEYEIVHCTARNNDVLTVSRGMEGTGGKAFAAGDRAELRLTAGALLQMLEDIRIAAQLTYTPIQQGGGANQAGNKLYLGWDGTGLRYQVDAIDRGRVWDQSNLNPADYMPLAGGSFNGQVNTANINSSMAVENSGSSLQVNNNHGTSDGGMAMMTFLCHNAYGIKMGLRNDGTFGIGGWSRGTWSWYTGPGGDMVAAGNVAAYSDPRLKDDISRIGDALEIIEQLDGVRFTWNHRTQLIGKPGERDIGILADQVEAVLPEIVGRSVEDEENGGERWRVVAYDKLVPVLIEAVKTLSARVKALEVG